MRKNTVASWILSHALWLILNDWILVGYRPTRRGGTHQSVRVMMWVTFINTWSSPTANYLTTRSDVWRRNWLLNLAFSFHFPPSNCLKTVKSHLSIHQHYPILTFFRVADRILNRQNWVPWLVKGKKKITRNKKDSKKLYKSCRKKDSWFHILPFPQSPFSILNPSFSFIITLWHLFSS